MAEVLITLGIIGIVAAMTLPTLINDKKHRELETAFKKSYSTLSQVSTRVISEDYGGITPIITSETITEFMNNFKKYYTNSPACNTNRNCTNYDIQPSSGGFAGFLQSNYQTYNGKTPNSFCNDGLIELNDGSLLFFDWAYDTESLYGKNLICVDTNGWKKKPNKLGHDFFMFQLKENGQLLPMGASGTIFPSETYCSTTSTISNNGYGCTAKAISEKDYFKNLP